ncbi:MAG: mechanosensitive ion channel [Anaerolineaceae bacterium]|nr:mechanosensitive ion channel [Anaerolineaceae bacterium]MCB9099156.1 mechanosensitive ion channel [Anaerolineales bacterium]
MANLESFILLNALIKLGMVVLIFSAATLLHRLAEHLAGLILRFGHRNHTPEQAETKPKRHLVLEDWLPDELITIEPLRLERQRTLRELLSSLISVTAFITAAIISLALFADTDTLVWTIGFFTAGISFAAGPVVGDLLSGVSIIFQDKLVVGEKIRINSQFIPIEGIVERINLKSTQLRARTGEMYIVNNGELRYICNFSRGPYSATSLRIKIAAADLLPALALLNRLAPEAPRVFPELNEPWLVFSEAGTMDHTTELTLALKIDFGQAARLRPKLMVFLQHHFAMEKIAFAN